MHYTEISMLPSSLEIYQTNIRIKSIRETFNHNNILTNDGKLYITISKGKYHLYNLFEYNPDSPKKIKLSDITQESIKANTTSPSYEATHRLVLNKDENNNNYYATLEKVGELNSQYLYALDIDYVENLSQSDNGYFYSKTYLTDTKVSDLYTYYQATMFIKFMPYDANINISINNTPINYENNKFYYNISTGPTNANYNKITITGNSNSPKQIILEVF